MPVGPKATARAAAQDIAVLNAVRNTRFMPAQTPLGEAVAVDMVWVIAKTTALTWPPESLRTRVTVDTRAKGIVKPPAREPDGPPVSSQPVRSRRSATA